MSDERREILRMLADKVITVDEAERLLLALGEGEKRGRNGEPLRSSSATGSTGGSRRAEGPFGAHFEELGTMLGNIGEIVGERIQDAMGRISFEIEPGDDEEEGEGNLPDIPVTDGRFVLPEGVELDIRMVGHPTGGQVGRLELTATTGDQGEIRLASPDLVRVRGGERRIRVDCRDGVLGLAVPASVGRIRAKILAGDILADHVPCEVKMRTAGGQIDLIGLEKDFRVKSLGGGIRLQVPAAFQGRGQADTMGGVIDVQVDEGVDAELSATCLGGTVTVDPGVGTIKSSRGFGHQKVRAQIGAGNGPARLDLKTMGGEIRVSRTGSDSAGQVEPVVTDEFRRR